MDAIVSGLESRARKITSNDEIAQVGTISANGDTEIGRFLADAMQSVDFEPPCLARGVPPRRHFAAAGVSQRQQPILFRRL
ncbi:hypothetical protein [Bradyrhizobium liaoningense]